MTFRSFIESLLFAAVLATALVAPARADDPAKGASLFTPEQIQEIERNIHTYLLAHPEVFAEAAQKLQEQDKQAEDQKLSEAAKGVKPVTGDDHIRGEASAAVKVIEFSDFECPFCKSFHASMKQVMQEYLKVGKVAWVYRHFPIDELHSKARKEAQAAECAAELGGNKAFWSFADGLFEIAPSNNQLDLSLLPKIAEGVGLDKAKFEDCLKGDQKGGKFAAHIEANVQDAQASGGTGTPYSLVINAKGHIFPVNGAMSAVAMKAIIGTALKEE